MSSAKLILRKILSRKELKIQAMKLDMSKRANTSLIVKRKQEAI